MTLAALFNAAVRGRVLATDQRQTIAGITTPIKP
jgi:hypothetical protein